ncbi:hypothetical protein BDR26DRAFT_870332, partial [Obelidium mucronatum]
ATHNHQQRFQSQHTSKPTCEECRLANNGACTHDLHPFPDQCPTKNPRLKSCVCCRLANRKCEKVEGEGCKRCTKLKVACVFSNNSTRNKAFKELKQKLKTSSPRIFTRPSSAKTASSSSSASRSPSTTVEESDIAADIFAFLNNHKTNEQPSVTLSPPGPVTPMSAHPLWTPNPNNPGMVDVDANFLHSLTMNLALKNLHLMFPPLVQSPSPSPSLYIQPALVPILASSTTTTAVSSGSLSQNSLQPSSSISSASSSSLFGFDALESIDDNINNTTTNNNLLHESPVFSDFDLF